MQAGESSQETLEKDNEILLPKNIARAFGRALRQSMFYSLQEIQTSLDRLEGQPNHQRMKGALDRISRVLFGLERAREVRLKQNGPGGDFSFSEETEEEEPKQEEVLTDSNITPKLISALNHTIKNPLSIVSGFAEGAQSAEAAKNIIDASKQIQNVLESFNNAQRIKISTDSKGYTKITPIRDLH